MSVGRLKRVFSQFGAFEGALYLAARALSAGTGGALRLIRYHIVAQPVPPPKAGCQPKASKTTIRIVDRHDPITQAFPRPPEVIRRRFDSGDTCFVAQVNGGFAGFLWIAHDAYEEDEVRCRYAFGAAGQCVWDYDVYVAPEYRIGRTFSRLWDTANAHLAECGVKWSLSRISAFNPASLAAHRRLGAQKLYSASFLCLFGVQLSAFSRAPFVHFGVGHARPVLELSAPPPVRTQDENTAQ